MTLLLTLIAGSLLTQRSQSQINLRRTTSALFTPSIERMMRATDRELLVYASSTNLATRGDAIGEIVYRHLTWAAPVLARDLESGTTSAKLKSITIAGLGRLGNRSAVPSLRKAFRANSIDVQTSAAFALGALGDRQSCPAMRKLLLRMDEQGQRLMVRILGNFGDKNAEPPIRKLLQLGKYQGLRTVSAEALGKIGNRRSSVPALIEALRDPYPDVRRASAMALAALGDRRAVPALEWALQHRSPQAGNAPIMERRSIEAIRAALDALTAG